MRYRRRTSVGANRKEKRFGFRSKTRLQTRGFVELKVRVQLNGQIYDEYGYSQTGIVKNDWETMFDDARLNAFVKVLYRDGYAELNEANYETEIENNIEGWDILNYIFIYPESPFRSLGNETYYGKEKVVARRKDGSIKYVNDREDKKDVVNEYYKEFELRK